MHNNVVWFPYDISLRRVQSGFSFRSNQLFRAIFDFRQGRMSVRNILKAGSDKFFGYFILLIRRNSQLFTNFWYKSFPSFLRQSS